LRELSECSIEEYRSNELIRRATERLLHLAIEACLDIGHHLIAERGYRAPQDNRDVFRVLAEEGILPGDLLGPLQEMASFRNLLVHGYTRLDDEIVHGILTSRLEDFEAFAQSIIGAR
jgi:uncharacterized protein YutE (UPF0331/DUF86 family)